MTEAAESFNTQEYLNSIMRDSSVAEVAESNPDRLFNRKEPNLAIQHEKPEHRLAIMLKATKGMSNREIARVLGYTDAWVSQLFRQPWAQERLLTEMRSDGGDSIKALIEAEAANNVFTLIEVRDAAATPPAVKATVANSLLDRFMGKAPEKVTIDSTHRVAGDIESVDRELQALRQEEARLCGKTMAANVDVTEAEHSEAQIV